MAKNYDRGLGRSMQMHEKLIDRAERKMFFYGEDRTTSQPAPEPKRAWTPERWANRITRAAGK